MADHDILPEEPEDRPETIEERFEALWESLGKTMADMGVETGFVACIDPETDKLRMFYRGHFYDAAKIVTSCANQMKGQVAEDLG